MTPLWTCIWLTWGIGSVGLLLGVIAVAVFFGTKWTELSRTMFWVTGLTGALLWPVLCLFGWVIESMFGGGSSV